MRARSMRFRISRVSCSEWRSLAQDHFRWRDGLSADAAAAEARNAFVLPVYFIVNMVSFSGMEERYLSTVGRLTMMIGMLVFSALLWRVLHPGEGRLPVGLRAVRR